jgi:hypothetical protein
MDDFDLEPSNVDMEITGQRVQEDEVEEGEEEDETRVQADDHE